MSVRVRLRGLEEEDFHQPRHPVAKGRPKSRWRGPGKACGGKAKLIRHLGRTPEVMACPKAARNVLSSMAVWSPNDEPAHL